MEHLPTPTIVTVLPVTVQTFGVDEVKLTGSPDDAAALMVNGGTPKITLASGPKVIVCLSGVGLAGRKALRYRGGGKIVSITTLARPGSP